MLCVLMLPLAFDAFLSLGLLGVQAVLYSLQVWIVCVLLFDFPFILWALDFLPSYYLAAFLGILLGGGLLFWQSLFMQYYWYPFIHKKDEQTKTPGSQ